MKLFALAVIALALASTAHADLPGEPAPVLVGAGLGFPVEGLGAEGLVEAAYRPIDGLPLRAHAMFAKGTGDLEDYGQPDFWHVRGGVEGNWCGLRGYFCFVLDLDAGMLRVHADDLAHGGAPSMPAVDRDGLLLAARPGFDTGNRHVRFRLTIDFAKSFTGPFLVHDGFGDPLSLASVSTFEAEIVGAF